MRRFVLLLAIPAALLGQGRGAGAAATPPPTPPEDMCTLEGKVLNAATLEPVKKAQLTMQKVDAVPSQAGFPTSFGTATDDSGTFAMKDIEPGQYRISVMHGGFVTAQYGARAPGRAGTVITLVRKQRIENMDIRMTPHGVVAGRVLDEDGEPFPNVQVQLLTVRYGPTGKQLTRSGGATTNDLGEYRAYGIAPGKYFLNATILPMGPPPPPERPTPGKPEEGYVITYYPRAADPSAAAQVEVLAGQQMRGIDVRLMKGHTVHVRGTVTSSVPGRHVFNLYLLPRSTAGFIGFIRNYPVDSKGKFDISGVAPGPYSVQAMFQEGGDSYSARLMVDTGNDNVENANVNIGEGVTITGHITVDGNVPTDLKAVRITLQARAAGMIMFGNGSRRGGGLVGDNNSFQLPGVAPDSYDFNIAGLPTGYYVKSIRAEPVDVLASGLEVGNAPPVAVDIVLSANAADVSGTVQDEKSGQAFPSATVVMVPLEKDRAGRSELYRQAAADQSGAFQFHGVVPGEYKLYAFEDLEPGAYRDPEYMKPFDSSGTSATIKESDKPNLQLKLIPAPGK